MTRAFTASLAVAIALSACDTPARAQTIDVRVDERVELVAILFRLGGREEYNLTRVTTWATAVDSHFGRWKDHPAVVFTQRLATTYRVGFFVPMNLAVHLGPLPALEPRTSLPDAPALHRTWKTFPDSTNEFIRLAREFARDTRFTDFLRTHSALVDTTVHRIRDRIARDVDVEWFARFWGERPSARFVLVPGLTNGRASYGVEFQAPGAPAEVVAITGVTQVDSSGMPVFPASYATTVIHEFNHAFANALVDAHAAEFAQFGDSLIAPVRDQMRRQAYGSWDSVIRETLVRAAVVRYLAAHNGTAAAEAELAEQVSSGFTWLRQLDAVLAEYESKRSDYPTLRSFMPRVVQSLQDFAMSRR